MKRKISMAVLLLVILILINSVITGMLIFFIQNIQEPKIDVEFNFSQLTTDELRFSTKIFIINNNQYDLIIKNLNITGRTPDGDNILDLQFADSTVAANKQIILTSNASISFTGNLSSKIYSSIQGVAGINFAGIFEKTMPFHLNISASFQDLFINISSPHLDVMAEVSEISQDGILYRGNISIDNPNFFEMFLENFTVYIETENGNNVGEVTTIAGVITANEISDFSFNGTLNYEALNAKILILRMSGIAWAHVMGINKSIPLSTTAQLTIPDIKQLLFGNESLEITLSLQMKIRLQGVLTMIGLALYNPSNIPLEANDLVCSIYGLSGEKLKMIAQQPMKASTIESKKQDYLETEIMVPYLQLFTAGTQKILPDWYVIRIEGNFSIAGVNQSIPVSIDATINPRFLKS